MTLEIAPDSMVWRRCGTVIAAMEANHPRLTTQKTLYVEISRARHRAELVTDDRAALRERLEADTGERVAALEAIEPVRGKAAEAGSDKTRERERGPGVQEARPPIPKAVPQVPEREQAPREQAPRERKPEPEKVREGPELELDLGLSFADETARGMRDHERYPIGKAQTQAFRGLRGQGSGNLSR